MRSTRFRATTWCALMVAGATLVFYLFASSRTTIWDRDEAYYAEVASEMARSGNVLVPTFNGSWWLQKPPLVFWLMALSIRALGTSAVAIRLLSPVATALTALLVFAMGRRLFSPRAGLIAMGFFVVAPLTFVEGTAATLDAVLVLLTTCAMVLHLQLLDSGRPATAIVLFGAVTGLAQLAKGPVGVAVPCAAAALAWLIDRRAASRRRVLGALLAATLGTTLFLLWAIPANVASSGRLVTELLGVHIIGRALTPMEGHGGRFLLSLPYYIPVVMIGFLPGVMYLPGALAALRRRSSGDTAAAVLSGWIAAPIVLFSFVATKLPHYVYPAWPALALAAGAAVDAAIDGRLGATEIRWMRRGAWLFIPAGIALTVAAVALPAFLGIEALRLPSLVAGVATAILAAIALREHFAGRWKSAATALLTGAVILATLATVWILPIAEQTKPVPAVAEAIRASAPLTSPVAVFRFAEPSLVFHLGRVPVATPEDVPALSLWLAKNRQGIVVIPRSELKTLPAGALPPTVEIASRSGWNVSNGRRVELVVLMPRSQNGPAL